MNGKSFLLDSNEKIANPPDLSEYEVSVFGRGYGECIVLSCGNRDFVIIDSFINPNSGRPIALDYLDCLEISYNKIKQVIITHWHDDHIRGISEIISSSNENIQIVLNPIIKERDFLKYVQKGTEEGGDNGLSEFGKVMNYIENHKNNVRFALRDTRIFSDEERYPTELYALAPQDAELLQYIKTFIAPNLEERISAPYYRSDNDLSLVLLLKCNHDGALLGGDLQNSSDKSLGWDIVIDNYSHKNTRPLFYKVPHHGSKTGFNERIWSVILGENPYSVITAFNKGKKLPDASEIIRIKEKSNHVFVIGGAQKDRSKELNFRRFDPGVKIESHIFHAGMVRYRKKINTNQSSIEHFGHVEIY